MSDKPEPDAIEVDLYLFLSLSCNDCHEVFEPPDAHWDGIPEGESVAQVFTNRAAPDARAVGWMSIDGVAYCPSCAAKRTKSS